MIDQEIKLEGGGRSLVSKIGDTVYRPREPWSDSVQAFLRHLEDVGFDGAPRVIGTGYDGKNRETLSFIDGEFIGNSPWSNEAAHAVGALLGKLHQASKTFRQPENAVWRNWFGRYLPGSSPVIGHCDFAPWNLVCKNGIPFAAIDWETAGPVDAVVELAQACWLNAQLCDDDVAERAGLGSTEFRINQMKIIIDAYSLPKQLRPSLLIALTDVAICDAADQAIEAKVTPETQSIEPLWRLAWRTRAAAWMVKHRQLLSNALQ